MNGLSPDLDSLGDALERAAERDVIRSQTERRRRSRRLAVAAVAVAVAIPGLAFAADRLIGGAEVARSLPAGVLALAGTNASCTVVVQDVEYHCVLERPPAPEVADWKGTVEPTVDATKHVNGGCRSLRSDGLSWQCYIGRAAVDEQIIGEGFLGEYAPSPGVG
jgi:hypothetical protein